MVILANSSFLLMALFLPLKEICRKINSSKETNIGIKTFDAIERFNSLSPFRQVLHLEGHFWSAETTGSSNHPNADGWILAAERRIRAYFGVAGDCTNVSLSFGHNTETEGVICICGHPVEAHPEDGMCSVSPNICLCRGAKAVLWVSDKRFFYKATKGPHESHALLLGIADLESKLGRTSEVIPWVCRSKRCLSTSKVGPVRMRNGNKLALHVSVTESHAFMCETCLIQRLDRG